MRTLLGLGAAVAATAVAQAPALAATTITVNTTADNTPTGTECSGAAGDCSLRQAIDKASAGDTINFASSLSGKTITLTNGVLTISKTLTIKGPGANKLRVSGESGSFDFTGGYTVNVSDKLSGLKITGDASSSPAVGVSLNDSQSSTSNSVTLSRDVITANKNTSGDGGAVGGFVITNDTLTISHSTISHNRAVGGAGLLQYGSGKVRISSSTFADNAGYPASPGSGGAVFVQGTTTIAKSTFTGNSAATGGAIYFQASTTSTVTASTFSGNKATASTSFTPAGGGVFVQSGQVNIANSTFTKNSAKPDKGSTGYGGAIFRCCGAPTINLVSDTVVANSAFGPGSTGGDVNSDHGSTVRALDTIIADGMAATKGYTNCGEVEISLGYNLSSGNCGFTKKGDRINTQPKLAGLARNGGPTATMAEKSSSPTVDHGSPKSKCTARDQRGKKRPDRHESRCDIGAYELQDK